VVALGGHNQHAGNVLAKFRHKKNIKIVQPSLTTAFAVELTSVEYGVTIVDTILVGPCLPGWCIASLCTSAKTKIRILASALVKTSGRTFVPDSYFLNFSCAQWTQMTESTCAWDRIVGRKQLPTATRLQARYEPHILFGADIGAHKLVQPPPATIRTATQHVRCAYCRRRYYSLDAFAKGCAPDYAMQQLSVNTAKV
jgi:hypothetical protein